MLDGRGDVATYRKMGRLNRFQQEAVQYYVKGRFVWDLGAGAMGWAHELVKMGAKHVTAVDQLYKYRHENYLNNMRDWKKCAPDGVEVDDRTFFELVGTGPRRLSVAFVSWPEQSYGATCGLELLVDRAETVIYLGNNFDCTACGSAPFWNMLTQRKVLCTLPSRINTLTVYGGKATRYGVAPQLLPEEAAALSSEIHLTPAWFP